MARTTRNRANSAVQHEAESRKLGTLELDAPIVHTQQGELVEYPDKEPDIPSGGWRSQPTSPIDNWIGTLIERGDLDKLEKLMELREKEEQRLAKNAYFQAISMFRELCPVIERKGRVKFEAKNGGANTDYAYARFEDIVPQIQKPLVDCALSYYFTVDQEPGLVSVTTYLTHAMGHTEKTTISGPVDTSGNKDGLKAIASAISYLKRYGLGALLGFATKGEDDDAELASAPVSVRCITKDQVESVKKLLEDYSIPIHDFLKKAEIDSIDKLPAKSLNKAINWIKAGGFNG